MFAALEKGGGGKSMTYAGVAKNDVVHCNCKVRSFLSTVDHVFI